MTFTMPPTQTVPFTLDLPEGRIEAEVAIPNGPMRLAQLAHSVIEASSVAADIARRQLDEGGMPVSCRRGCAFCCRPLVPVSPPEAWMIAELVESMPDSWRERYRRRFELIHKKLDEIGFLQRLDALFATRRTKEDYDAIAAEYWKLQIPCPFLNNEACGIYEYRPTVCREYMVTSPAENCRDPYGLPIARVPLSLRLSEALARLTAELLGGEPRVIPLSIALSWSEKNSHARWLGWDPRRLVKGLEEHIRALIPAE